MGLSPGNLKLTEQEKRIYSYIIDKPDLVLNNTSEGLAKIIYSSPSALNRFAKKFGYKGYAEFRINFAIDYNKPNNEAAPDCLSRIDDLLHNKLPDLYLSVIEKNKNLLTMNPDMLQKISYALSAVSQIDIYATGVNYYLSRAMCAKLTEAGYDVHVANYVDLDYLNHANSDNHLAIILSRTGKNPTCLYAAEQNARAGIKTLSISRENCLILSEKCTYSMFAWIPQNNHPQKNAIQTLSLNYCFDFLAVICNKKTT